MDTEYVRQRLNTIIKHRGLSMRQVSLSAGLGDQLLRNVLTGRTHKLKPEALKQILNALDLSEDKFFEKDAESVSVATPDLTCHIPIFGEIPAGNPTWVEGKQQPSDYVLGDARDKRLNAFALRVRGESMAPDYRSGDVLFLRPLSIGLSVKNPSSPVPRAAFDALVGRAVAVLVNNEATLKTLKIEQRPDNDYWLHLKPINPEFPVITIQDSDEAQFQGEVYKLVREI